MTKEEKNLVKQKNTLLRYKKILEIYNNYKTEDIADTVILRKYICPVYPICRTTLWKVLGTPIEKLLKQIQEIESSKLNAAA